MSDDLGDRLKGDYETPEAGRRVMPRLPVVARLDGKNFSTFTRGLARPYDKRLSDLMVAVTTILVRDTAATCGYTQSDEITLGWYSTDPKSQIYFDGKIQKIVSVLAATASVLFNHMLPVYLPEKVTAAPGPVFDCRVWGVPTLDEGANAFLWREQDATKNAISMAARHYYSHKELHEKTGSEMQELLFAKGVNFNDYPAFFKRGTYVRRRQVTRKLTPEELTDLPPLHHARANPDLEFTRTVVDRLTLPPLTQVMNRAGVLFLGEDPLAPPADASYDAYQADMAATADEDQAWTRLAAEPQAAIGLWVRLLAHKDPGPDDRWLLLLALSVLRQERARRQRELDVSDTTTTLIPPDPEQP